MYELFYIVLIETRCGFVIYTLEVSRGWNSDKNIVWDIFTADIINLNSSGGIYLSSSGIKKIGNGFIIFIQIVIKIFFNFEISAEI